MLDHHIQNEKRSSPITTPCVVMQWLAVRCQRPTIHLLLLLLVFAAGCSSDIDTVYGQRQGMGASKSVNGTAVLADMFQGAGHRVFSWSALSPCLQNQADCIVWFPNDFEPPSPGVRRWMEEWLEAKPDRTLIYVGRDFDAEIGYWERVLPNAPPAQEKLVKNRLEDAKSDFATARRHEATTTNDKTNPSGSQRSKRSKVKPKSGEWFAIDLDAKPRQVRTVNDDSLWRRDIDPAKLEIELNGRMILASDANILLASGKDTLVGHMEVGESQLILVANGSFLLNLPLINHEHRKLAGKLIDVIGPTGQTVVFLESYRGGPPIRDEDPAAKDSSGLEIFNMWPTNWILLHLAALGILFCFSRWPIFGLAREIKSTDDADFGRHIDALADLLQKNGNVKYAMEKIAGYKEKEE
jgi:hypothetical protein